MFPLKAPFSSGISQPSMFDDTGSNGTEMPRHGGILGAGNTKTSLARSI
jgi:hypothetical protein